MFEGGLGEDPAKGKIGNSKVLENKTICSNLIAAPPTGHSAKSCECTSGSGCTTTVQGQGKTSASAGFQTT